jgi:hypothetical protein
MEYCRNCGYIGSDELIPRREVSNTAKQKKKGKVRFSSPGGNGDEKRRIEAFSADHLGP